MTILTNPFRAGSGIDINYNTGTIANSGVLSVDSNTGNLSLSAGTGISISGLTITNTGVDSLVAGTGISLSGSTGSVTVTNSGVTSFQGDTGSISLSAGTGISISGLTISNAGVTSLQSETGALSLTAGTGISISGLTITNTGITSLTAGNGISVSGSTIAMSGSYSGNFTASGLGTFATINSNSSSSSGSAGGDEIIALYGGIQSFPSSTTANMFGFGMSGYTMEIYSADNINLWQLNFSTSTPAFSIGGADSTTGTQFLVKTANNVLDDGTGNLEIGNTYYKWSNSANNYVYADTGNMVFGTNGGFQWKNSSGTIISGLNSSGDMTLTGGLTLGSQQSVVWTNTTSGNVGSFTAVQYSNRFAMFPTTDNSNAFTIENTSLDNIFTVALASSSVGTLHNTLDNGSGDMTVAGSITVNSGGTMTIGVSGMTFEGDANDPSILIYDTANSNYNITIGQASSNGAYFTNAVTGDSIIRGNYERLLLGVTSEDAGLILTSGYSVTTKNNTLDNGSGDMTIAGSLTINEAASTTTRAITFDSSGYTFIDTYGNFHLTQSDQSWGVIDNTTGTTFFFLENSAYQVSTLNNTLDNGSGAMTVASTLSVSGEIKGNPSQKPLYSGFGSFEGTYSSDFTATYAFGSVVVDAGYSFTNGTGGTIVVIFEAQDGDSIAGAGVTGGTIYYLAPTNGTDAYVHIIAMDTSAYLQYNSFAISYTWFLMN